MEPDMNETVKPSGAIPAILQVRKIGNSIGLILPKELLAQTGFAEGDKVEAILQPDGGIRLKPHDDLHARSMEIARRAMKQYAGALRELAK
jgi:putative addiction module antidote